jgi:hypothetical protein
MSEEPTGATESTIQISLADVARWQHNSERWEWIENFLAPNKLFCDGTPNPIAWQFTRTLLRDRNATGASFGEAVDAAIENEVSL